MRGAGARACGCEQVGLGVGASQHPAVSGDLVAVQVAKLAEQRAHPAEDPGDHVRPAGYPAVQRVGLAFGPQVLLCLPGMRVVVLTAIAGVLSHSAQRVSDLLLGTPDDALAIAAAGGSGDVTSAECCESR